MFWMRKSLLIAIATTVAASFALGQSVTWSPSEGTLQEGKTYGIYLSFVGCEADGQPPQDLSNDDLQLTLGGGVRQNSTIINGRSSFSVDYGYQISAKHKGAVSIPSFDVQTDKGPVTVPAAQFEATEATVGNTGIRPDEILLSRFDIKDNKIYAGEVFDLDYYAGVDAKFRMTDLSDPEWKPNDLVATDLKAVKEDMLNIGGHSYNARQYHLRAMGTHPGLAKQPGMKQTIQLAVGTRGRGFFQETVYDAFNLKTDPFSIEILPLPEGAPPSFRGAVGDFKLQSKVVPAKVQSGEPITWTLELSGEGNWPAGIGVPPRSVSSSFKAIQPVTKNEFAEGDVFTGKQTEDIVLIPTKAGEFIFGPLTFSYFDPKQGKYLTIDIPAETVTVEAAAGTSNAAANSPQGQSEDTDGGGNGFSEDDLRPTGENLAKRLPSLPREPATSETDRPVPTGRIELLRPTLLAIAAPIALWILLALIKAIALDPNKSRRQGYARMRKLTNEARRAVDLTKSSQTQHAWRKAARVYWGLDTAEATPLEIQTTVEQQTTPDLALRWRRLWEESDRILYSGQAPDLATWQKLVDEALVASPKPCRSLSPFLAKAAWFGATLIAVAALNPHPLSAEEAKADSKEDTSDPIALYQSGDFAGAEKLWIQAAHENPSSWQDRYNAGLAAAQQERWANAWAHWTSAYCLNPGDPRIVWNLRVAQTKTDAYDPDLQDLLTRHGTFRIVGVLSPAAWERLAYQLIWIAGGLLCLAVASRYLATTRKATSILIVFAFISGLGAYFSQWAHSKYGALAQPETVLIVNKSDLRTIPSDLAKDDQLKASVSEGTVAAVKKSFLGWSKVELPNGDIGWIRKEDYQPLYGPPNATN